MGVRRWRGRGGGVAQIGRLLARLGLLLLLRLKLRGSGGVGGTVVGGEFGEWSQMFDTRGNGFTLQAVGASASLMTMK